MKGSPLPGLGGPLPIIGRDPFDFSVWPEAVPEAQAIRVKAPTPTLAVMMALAGFYRQGVADGVAEIPREDEAPEDFFLRDCRKRIRRVRVLMHPLGMQIAELQACRICGCCEDRACNPPCAWVEDDRCSRCRPEIIL